MSASATIQITIHFLIVPSKWMTTTSDSDGHNSNTIPAVQIKTSSYSSTSVRAALTSIGESTCTDDLTNTKFTAIKEIAAGKDTTSTTELNPSAAPTSTKSLNRSNAETSKEAQYQSTAAISREAFSDIFTVGTSTTSFINKAGSSDINPTESGGVLSSTSKPGIYQLKRQKIKIVQGISD